MLEIGAQVVGHAGTAHEAISDILAKRPDMVLCDLNLTQGTGFDVLRAVTAQAPGIECYMLSNFSTQPYRRLAAELGARDFFDKSSEFERVRDGTTRRMIWAPRPKKYFDVFAGARRWSVEHAAG